MVLAKYLIKCISTIKRLKKKSGLKITVLIASTIKNRKVNF